MVDPKHNHAPLWLEIALTCEDNHIHPGILGFAQDDPRNYRIVRRVLDVYHTATERKRAKNKFEWDKKFSGKAKMLREVRSGASEDVPLAPNEGRVSLPERPKDWRTPATPKTPKRKDEG